MKPLSIALCVMALLSMAKFCSTHSLPFSGAVSMVLSFIMCVLLVSSK